MTTQIDWEAYNEAYVCALVILEQHTHYLHFQIASILNCVFDKYKITGPRVELLWNKIKTIRPEWLESHVRLGHEDPSVRMFVEQLERRQPILPSAMPTYDELLNGRGAFYLLMDELLNIEEDDWEGFGWRTSDWWLR